MDLKIPRAVFDEMVRVAKEAVPLEACGLLAGKDCHVTKCYPLTNADASPVHCSMIPEEQFAAMKDMRKLGLQMLAIWHSHPATPARMSQEDVRLAYTPSVAYIILSLAQPGEPKLRGFEIDNGVSKEIDIIVAKS